MQIKRAHRNVPMEMLRVLMMFGIVTLHFLGHGGGIALAEGNGIAKACVWLLESVAYLSVNVFVLITGYYQSTGTFKWKKVLDLIIQITFWSAACYVMTILTGTEVLSMTTIIKVLLPWLFGEYWFPSVYLGLYVLSPYLNKLVIALEQKDYQKLLFIGTVLCCCPFLQDSVKIGGGMSLLWFCHLYITAGYLRRYELEKKHALVATILAGCVLLLWVPNIIDNKIIGYLKAYEWSYYSLPTYIGAVAMFLLFVNRESRSKPGFNRFICRTAGLTFGVFLIHDNIHLRVWLWDKVTMLLPEKGFTPANLWMIPVVVLSVFTGCAFLEFIRQNIFNCIRFGKISQKDV